MYSAVNTIWVLPGAAPVFRMQTGSAIRLHQGRESLHPCGFLFL